MEVTSPGQPATPTSPRRFASQVALGDSDVRQHSSHTFLVRRASCKDDNISGQTSSSLTRGGSLKNRSASVMQVGGLAPLQTSHVTKERGEKSCGKTTSANYPLSPLPPDKSLFLSFDNIKGAIFGDSKLLSPNKSGENVVINHFMEQDGLGKNKLKTETSVQKIDRTHKSENPVKDEFTEFSQYGSRFHATQFEEKSKKATLADQFPGHRIVQKVAKTCQKHTRSKKSAPSSEQRNDKYPVDADESKGQLGQEKEPREPTARPRSKKEKQRSLLQEKVKDEIEKLDPKVMEEKSAMLFKSAELHQPISMNTDPKPHHHGIAEAPKPSSSRGSIKLRGFSCKSDSDSGFDGDSVGEIKIKQVNIHAEYDLVQLIGEGWFSRVYLAEHRHTRDEVVLKAINSNLVTADEFCREYHSSTQLYPHKNILKVYDAVFQCDGYYMFAMEYAPLGDLTSNISETGLAEIHTKHIACQVGSALQWIHSKNMCHLDVKLDNILVFRSDFSLVKLCDFGSVKPFGDIVIKKNELLPYCPAELVARHANEYYQVDKVQDVFQFGIVVFFCLQGVLPWQKADRTDPHFAEFCSWREKRTSKVPRNFKPLSSRAQKLFRKLLDPNPSKRLELVEMTKYMEDRWLRKGIEKAGAKDGQSQLTLGSFQSVHSNLCEKNCLLYTLLQHGVETTVDRSSKNNRIRNWINQGAQRTDSVKEEENVEELTDVLKPEEDELEEDIEIVRVGTPE